MIPEANLQNRHNGNAQSPFYMVHPPRLFNNFIAPPGNPNTLELVPNFPANVGIRHHLTHRRPLPHFRFMQARKPPNNLQEQKHNAYRGCASENRSPVDPVLETGVRIAAVVHLPRTDPVLGIVAHAYYQRVGHSV